MNTGSRAPHSSRAGTSVSSASPRRLRPAPPGWGGPAPAGCRPRSRRPQRGCSGSAYGWASPSRTAARKRGPRDSAAAVADEEPASGRRRCRAAGRDRASRISAGGAAAGSWCTAVLASTMPGQPVAVAAAPSPARSGPPQSWATGPRDPRCRGRRSGRPRSSIRSASRRGRGQALGPAHPEVVDRDHPPARRGGGQEPSPQVGPGGVAVDAEHGPGGGSAPLSSTCQRPGHALPVGHRSPGATSAVEPVQARDRARAPTHQMISA